MEAPRIGRAVTLQKRPNRSHWLAKRRKGITATDVPAILGLDPYRTPLDVWLDKTGRAKPVDENYAMRRGKVLEALLLTEYAQRTKTMLLPVPILAGHPTNRIALASLDGAADHFPNPVRIVECKTTGWRGKDDWWDDTKQIPDNYLAQVAWQQYVTGLDFTDVIADVAGDVRIIGPIPRSIDWEAYVVPLIAEWWQKHVVGGIAPDVDPVRDYESMNLLWRPDPEQTRMADDDLIRLVDEYQRVSGLAKYNKALADAARGQIRMAMKDASVLIDSWTGDKLASIDKRGTLRITGRKEPAA